MSQLITAHSLVSTSIDQLNIDRFHPDAKTEF